MKKALLLSMITISLITLSGKAFAQCKPDTTIKSTGIFPAVLDTATTKAAYSKVLQYFVTKDTSISYQGVPINAIIDSIFITGVKGLPTGLTYTCGTANCKSLGGKTGCVTLAGTPAVGTGGNHPLVVYLSLYGHASLGGIPINQIISDSNSRYAIYVKTATGVGSIYEESGIAVYPNPAHGELYVQTSGRFDHSSFEIYNLQGELCLMGQAAERIDISGLRKGLYVLKVGGEGKVLTKKFLVE